MRIGQSYVISYLDLCRTEAENLQRGMNYSLRGRHSVVLMSVRPGAPYADRVEEGGRVLIYEGHDISRRRNVSDPKKTDQPLRNPSGSFTQNGKFFEAAKRHKQSKDEPELVRVYEKIKSGIWVYNGVFRLVDAWQETSGSRKVFKFKLELLDDEALPNQERTVRDLIHNRMIPTAVKLEVWKRDKGSCRLCGKQDNLHFDHVIPFSKGGASVVGENIQLLCARHNLQKHDRIE